MLFGTQIFHLAPTSQNNHLSSEIYPLDVHPLGVLEQHLLQTLFCPEKVPLLDILVQSEIFPQLFMSPQDES